MELIWDWDEGDAEPDGGAGLDAAATGPSPAVSYQSRSLEELRELCYHRASLVGRLEQELHTLQQPTDLEKRVEALENLVTVARHTAAGHPGEHARHIESLVEEISEAHGHTVPHVDHAHQ